MNRVEKVPDGYDVHFDGRVYPFLSKNIADIFLEEMESGELQKDDVTFLGSLFSYVEVIGE